MSQFPIGYFPGAYQELPNTALGLDNQVFMVQNDDGQIAIRTSEIGSLNWNEPIDIPNATSHQMPAIAFAGDLLYVVWTASDSSHTLYFTISNDGGRTFAPVTQISDAVTMEPPVIKGSQRAMVVFQQASGQLAFVVLP